MMNEVARALGNFTPQRGDEPEIGELMNWIAFSKSSEEVMEATKKFLDRKKVDFTRYISRINYEDDPRRRLNEE